MTSCSSRTLTPIVLLHQLLLPVLARPIVQSIVDESILGITTVVISDPTNAGALAVFPRLLASCY